MLVNILVPGTVKSFGVLFMEFLEAFDDATPSSALWIPALCYFLYSSLGMLNGVIFGMLQDTQFYRHYNMIFFDFFFLTLNCRSIIKYFICKIFISYCNTGWWNFCCIWNDHIIFCVIC